jgi:hypothetical protein
LTEVALLDSNFLVDVRRALAIAKGILKSSVRFQWSFQASTDLLCRMSDEEVQTLPWHSNLATTPDHGPRGA